MSNPNPGQYPPQPPQPGPPPPAGQWPPTPAVAPKNPLQIIRTIANMVILLGWVTLGSFAIAAIISLTLDNVDGTFKFREFATNVGLGAGLGGTALGIGALLKHKLLERGQI